jgi:hypothetical protein
MEALQQALQDRYSALRDQAEAEQGKGSADSIAYSNIVESLKKPEPRPALQARIRYAQEAIARHDQETWNRREGYREHYAREIALTELAIERYEAVVQRKPQAADQVSAYLDELFAASREQLQRMLEIIKEDTWSQNM